MIRISACPQDRPHQRNGPLKIDPTTNPSTIPATTSPGKWEPRQTRLAPTHAARTNGTHRYRGSALASTVATATVAEV